MNEIEGKIPTSFGEDDRFASWAILELMGHRRLTGHVSEETIAGKPMIRLDIFLKIEDFPNSPHGTQFYAPDAVYCISPTTPDLACFLASKTDESPVRPYELQDFHARQRQIDNDPEGGDVSELCPCCNSDNWDGTRCGNCDYTEDEVATEAFMPPTHTEAEEWFRELGAEEELAVTMAGKFINYYAEQGWMTQSGAQIKSWKAAGQAWFNERMEEFGE